MNLNEQATKETTSRAAANRLSSKQAAPVSASPRNFLIQSDRRTSDTADRVSNQGFFSRATIQPKLSINQPNDIYEQEADKMADHVMRMPEGAFLQRKCAHCEEEEKLQKKEPEHAGHLKPFENFALQRKCAHCEEEEKLQRKEQDEQEAHAGNQLEAYVGNLDSGGQSLPDDVRNFYEPRFGYDFGNVRVHTDTVAAKSAHSISALAYTNGNNIVFNDNQYSPGTDSGKKLLAHELTHVVQQGSAEKSVSRYVQRKEVCDATGCWEEPDKEVNSSPAAPEGYSIDPTQGGSSQAPPKEDGGFTPGDGGYSRDPLEGGSSQAPAPADGGFTPAEGARSYDPMEGGSSQAPPKEDGGFTPGDGGYSRDPLEGGSSQAPLPADGGFTPAEGAQSSDPMQGGKSEEPVCDRAQRSSAYQDALRKEKELSLAVNSAKISLERTKKVGYLKCVISTPSPSCPADVDYEIQEKQAAYDAVYLRYCHAMQDTQKALKDGGCASAVEIPC